MSLCWLINGERMHINRADPADAVEILQFLGLACAESDFLSTTPGDVEITVDQLRTNLAELAATDASMMLAAKVDGRVMAVASLLAPSQQRCAHTAELSIIVARGLWGQGAGSALLEELRERARAAGRLKMLHLGVREDNQRAIDLFHRFGFKVAGRLPGYFCVDETYYDQLLMALVL
ncbi:GNAT family N-acetyltransferase [Ruminococcaceae bacterium OttesenSCG-928-A11]|nr:GNAT family N-acetyltransferase [Ruminococcaceae bacterium OttesenSCG-928-A11]